MERLRRPVNVLSVKDVPDVRGHTGAGRSGTGLTRAWRSARWTDSQLEDSRTVVQRWLDGGWPAGQSGQPPVRLLGGVVLQLHQSVVRNLAGLVLLQRIGAPQAVQLTRVPPDDQRATSNQRIQHITCFPVDGAVHVEHLAVRLLPGDFIEDDELRLHPAVPGGDTPSIAPIYVPLDEGTSGCKIHAPSVPYPSAMRKSRSS